MRVLVIGSGEVGNAITNLVSKKYQTFIRDIEEYPLEGVEILHICYPEHANFVESTKKYIAQYQPRLTIINSSVSIGTTDKLGEGVVYSPVRGRHPNISEEMKYYPKFVAALKREDAQKAADHFTNCGLNVRIAKSPKSLEFMKLTSNIHMGLEIAWRQEVGRLIKKFEAYVADYDMWEDSYNEGYKELSQYQLIRPRMKPDPIGGHCIIECTKIMQLQHPSMAFDFIINSNEKTKFDRQSQ